MNYLLLDVGGSSIKYGVINDTMLFLDKGTIKAPHDSLEQFVEAIVSLYNTYRDKISGIGISMPGAINPEIGFAKTGGAYTFIKNLNLVDILKKEIPLPIIIGNDAKCAAYAELGFGVLKGVDDAALIVLGTGIGGCIVIDGKIHIGKSFASGEFSCIRTQGKLDIPVNDEWSTINGIEGLLHFVQRALNTDKRYTGKEIFALANSNHTAVLKGLDEFCKKLVYQIYNLQFMFDPQVIAIGGGISLQPLLLQGINKYVDWMYAYYEDNNYPLSKPNVVICKYGNDANLIGAYFQLKTVLEEKR